LISHNSNIKCSWTNGRKANVYLIEQECGWKLILKRYKTRFVATMVREYLLTKYLSRRLDIMPKVLGFKLFSRELVLSYIQGERVFEWVMVRYGDTGINIEDFRSYDYLDRCEIVDRAFGKFRKCRLPETIKLKRAIKDSYELLHKIGFIHGSADPRNIIYDGERIFIIDFDHSRPCLNPRAIEYRALYKWYGLEL
jgi:tRNA A-37 threonylcarbamoyl transferase component Bud32